MDSEFYIFLYKITTNKANIYLMSLLCYVTHFTYILKSSHYPWNLINTIRILDMNKVKFREVSPFAQNNMTS